MMKILHVYKDFDPPVHGGIERHIALNCRYQQEWAEVRALTCSRSPSTRLEIRDGTPVQEVGEWGRVLSTPIAPLFPYYLKRSSANVVVVHVPNPAAETSYLFARPRGTLVVRYHSDVVRQARAMKLYRPVLMKFLSKAAMILPTSEQYLQTSPYLQPFKERCHVVPLGVVTEDFDTLDEGRGEALRSEYGGRFVLFCGQHRYYKGLQYLVRAAGHIGAAVVVAGNGPERGTLEALSQKLGAGVHFIGRISDENLLAHLHACEVFVFPSIERSEAFGLSILEAHACAKPVVATQLGTGVEYANLHGETGLNVPPRDPEAFARAVNELLSDDALRRRLGERARLRVRETFHAKAVAQREFALYQEAMEWNSTGI